MMTYEAYYQTVEVIANTLANTEIILIAGFGAVILGLIGITPKVLKVVNQIHNQTMERNKLMIDVIKENTTSNIELRTTLEADRQRQERDGSALVKSLDRIHDRLDEQGDAIKDHGHILKTLLNDRRG